MVLKPTILLGLLCAAFAANPSLNGFRPGHHYTYNFDGQVSSSTSNAEDFSTIRIRSQVDLDFLNDKTVLVSLSRPQMSTLNGFLDEPQRLHALEKFEALEVRPDHVTKLEKPFEILYDNGKVAEIKFHADDSVWSENIKRSIVNLLQVQLEQAKNIDSDYQSSYFYQINETTIEGECETTYHIQKIDDSNYDSVEETKPSVNITKTVNYEKCKRRPELRYNYYRASEPLDWNSNTQNNKQPQEQQKESIEPVVDSISIYEISLENDVVQNSKVLSKYSYDLVNKDHVSLVTFTIGQLFLKGSERRSPPESEFTKKSPKSLMHSNELDLLKERFITIGDEAYLNENPYLRLSNAGEVVKNIIRRLLMSSIEKENAEGVEEDATRQFSHLVSILRLCSRNDIRQIHDGIFKNQEYNEKSQQFVKEILADALAVAGTKNTIDHLVEKIKGQEISPSKSARTLEKLYKLRLTSAEMAEPIRKLCDSDVAQNNENLKRSCFLAWGAMINAMCGHDHEHEHDHEKWAISKSEKKICPTSLKQQYIQDLMRVYERASRKSDKILVLKTLGNMGIDESIESLAKIIVDKSEDRMVRIHAIDAIRNLRDQIPQKIQRLLTPIFRDRREHPEIRMNVFHQILQTRPDSALLHMLSADMAHETNNDVKSFVVSSIQELAKNADNMLDPETASAVKSSLLLLEQMDASFVRQSSSKKHQFGYFSQPYNWNELGSLFTLASISSNDSYLPKEIVASWDMLMNGRVIPNTMQLGVHIQELEQLVARLSQNIQSKGFDDIVVRGRRSLMEEYNPIQMLKNLYNKMSLVARRNPSDAEPMFLFYRRHNNLDYSFFLVDEANLPEVLKKLLVEGRFDVQSIEEDNVIVRTNDAKYNFESQLKLPTTIGIPLVISSRMVTIGFVDGKYALSFGKTEKVRDANMQLEVSPQLASSVFIKMELFSPLFTSGIKTIHSIQGKLPLNMNVEIKSPNLVPKITWKLPEQEVRLFHAQSRPITFLRTWPEKSNVFIDAKEKTLLIPNLERTHTSMKKEQEYPLTGLRFTVEGHWYRRSSSNYDWLLSGENAVSIRITPTPNSAKSVQLSGEYMNVRDAIPAKQQLVKMFNERPELFQNTADEEVESLRSSIERMGSKLTDFKKLVLKLNTPEGSNSHSISMDLKVACTEHAQMCLFDKEIKADFGRDWTWKTIGQLATPELKGIYASVKSGHVVGKIQSNWGSEEKNTVALNLYGKPSEQRVKTFKSLLNKKLDLSDKYANEDTLDEKFEELPSKLHANEYIMSIEHQITQANIETIVPFYNWMKICPKANVYVPDASKVDSVLARKHSTLMARATFDNSFNLTLTTPEEQLEMINWETKPKLSQKSNSIVDMFASSHENYAKCTYKREQIDTFDGQTIDIPLTNCYTLLAKDCGDETNPSFALMAKKLSKRSKELKVKFITQRHAFELYKNEDNGKMVIKANNVIVTEAEFDRYNIRKVESTDTPTIYEIKSHHAQVIVRFDGQKIVIKIADLYMNRQCGVCGHMNNDREDDFLKNDKTQAKSVQDFHLSYLYRDGEECEPSAVQDLEEEAKPKSRRRLDVESNSYEENRNSRNPTKQTIIVEKRNEVCFSLKPVSACPKGFESAATEERQRQEEEVDFACLKRGSPEAIRYIREAREGIVNLGEETSDYTEKVIVPTRCVQY